MVQWQYFPHVYSPSTGCWKASFYATDTGVGTSCTCDSTAFVILSTLRNYIQCLSACQMDPPSLYVRCDSFQSHAESSYWYWDQLFQIQLQFRILSMNWCGAVSSQYFTTIRSIFQSMDHIPTPSRARIQWVVFLLALSVIFRYGVGFWVVQVGLIFRVLLILCQCETDIQFKQTSVHSTQTAHSKTHHKYLGSMTLMMKYPSHLAVG